MSHITSHTTQAAAAGLLSLSLTHTLTHTHTLYTRDTVRKKSHVTQCVIKETPLSLFPEKEALALAHIYLLHTCTHICCTHAHIAAANMHKYMSWLSCVCVCVQHMCAAHAHISAATKR